MLAIYSFIDVSNSIRYGYHIITSFLSCYSSNSIKQEMLSPCGRGRQNVETWFDNVAQNIDNGYNSVNYAKFIKSVDTRETNPVRHIFNGFTALDYAILTKNEISMTKYLADEILIPTNNSQIIKLETKIGNETMEVQVYPNTSCLQLATLLHFTQGMQLILKHITLTSQIHNIFFQNKNQNNRNNLDYMLYNLNSEVLDVIKQYPIILEYELQQSLQKDNILESLVANHRLSGIHFIYQLAQSNNSDSNLQNIIAEVGLKKYNGLNINQIAQKNVSQDEQLQNNVQLICSALYKQSYYYAKDRIVQGENVKQWEILIQPQ